MTGTPTPGSETTNAQLREQPGVLSEAETETKPSHDSTRTGTLGETMQITREDNPYPSARKGAPGAAALNFQAAHAALHRRYAGRPFDGAYRSEIERIEVDLGEALQCAPPIATPHEALALIDLEIMLLREFEGESPTGIHGTRLAGLEAVRAFLQSVG